MSLVPALTGTATALPLANTAPTPASGELVRAEDVQEAVQALLNQDASLEDDKLSAPGGVVSGDLEITGNLDVGDTLSADAITSSTSVAAAGDVSAGGSLNATSSINTGGPVHFTGTQPAAGADPGANNAYAVTQIRAWALVTFNAGVVTVHDNINVSGVTISGIDTEGVVTFTRAMANANYAVTFGMETIDHQATINSKTTSGFDFNITKSSDATLRNLTTSGPFKVGFHVAGR